VFVFVEIPVRNFLQMLFRLDLCLEQQRIGELGFILIRPGLLLSGNFFCDLGPSHSIFLLLFLVLLKRLLLSLLLYVCVGVYA